MYCTVLSFFDAGPVADIVLPAHLLDETAAVRPSISQTWLPRLARTLAANVRSKPAPLTSLQTSDRLGDIDGAANTRTPVDSESEGVQTPTEPEASGATNRKMRRAEVKSQSRKKK